jgi:hypothetical protein
MRLSPFFKIIGFRFDGSSCGLFTIAYAIDILFGLDPKQSIYIVLEM